MTGMKHDQGKTRFDLLDSRFTLAMANVMTFGAEKYAPNNWQKVEDFKARYTGALHRHLNAWQQGELIDEDSGCFHLAQIAVNAMFLFYGDLNEDSNVQQCRSIDTEVHTVSKQTCEISSRPNDEERDFSNRVGVQEIIEILDRCGTYEHTRARLYDLCAGRRKQVFSSTDYPA